jgi:hypothetical protein
LLVISGALYTLWRDGCVFELRSLRTKRATQSGYFDDPYALAKAAAELDAQGVPGVYVTINPVDRVLLARGPNVVTPYAKETTKDEDILRRHTLLIDIDPKRKAGISATNEEHEAALARALAIQACLCDEHGWAQPLFVDSGNGANLFFRIDLPNDAEATTLFKGVLGTLARCFDDDVVAVDQSVFNAARIAKIPGTMARKGADMPDRPHRRSRILDGPYNGSIDTIVTAEQLRAFVREHEVVESSNIDFPVGRSLCAFDLERFLAQHMIVKRGPEALNHRDGISERWIVACPFVPEHDGTTTAVIRMPGGGIVFKCHGNRCRGRRWSDVRALLESGPTNTAERARLSEQDVISRTFFSDAPRPIGSLAVTTPTMPSVLVPKALRPWVEDVAERMNVPLEMIAVPMILAASALVSRKLCIRPKRRDDWAVVPNLWGCVVGRPAMLKSPALTQALAPFKCVEDRLRREFEAGRPSRQLDQRMLNLQISSLEQLAKKSTADLDVIRGQLNERHQALRAADITEPRRLTNDPTTEKLGELLREHGDFVTDTRRAHRLAKDPG